MSITSHIAPDQPNHRALILPGGGMRVAYQAGAIQRLHEEGLRFSYGDGTSGGVMNLGALLSGVAPDDLAKRWRSLRPSGFISPLSLRGYLKFPNLKAFGDFDGITGYVYPHLGVDIDRIQAQTGVLGHFNVCDFGAKSVVAVPHDKITLNQMLAGMSLPMFTPATQEHGKIWTDAVWIKDANLLKAVEGGANELWVIWCIGNTDQWRDGTLPQYVHMIEMSAIAALNAELAEIDRLNGMIANGEAPFGHKDPIIVHVIRPDLPIPLDPDYVAGKVSGDALVDQGYMDASAYLAKQSASGVPLTNAATKTDVPGQGVTFRETMVGRLSFDTTDPVTGGKDRNAIPVKLNATINIRDIGAFIRDPEHRAGMAAHLYSPRLGFVRPATHSNFQLFSPTSDPDLVHMVYELGVLLDGEPHWFTGRKHVRRGPPWRMWAETTTLYVHLHAGTDAQGRVVAAGVLRLGILDFLRLMGTLSARDCSGLRQKARAVGRFAAFFANALLDTYFPWGKEKS
ncbi:MAG: patatin-like phospholipase family protein [Yoonia sp.]|uniref:patatin-like phospholipase family protein n=1 Tax=Yoonia sp. TaxID=2212373 RepID=UPI003EF12F78